MPTPTKDETSVDELEEAYNAPEKPHPLGANETNAYQKTQQPVIPSEESNPEYQQTGDSPKTPGQGDSGYGDSGVEDSQPSEGGQSTPPTGKKKWRERAKEWNEKRKKNKAMRQGKKAIKKLAKEAAQRTAEQAAKRGADVVAPGSGEVVVRGGKVVFIAGKAFLTGNYKQGFNDIVNQVKGPIIAILIMAAVALSIMLILIIIILVFLFYLFDGDSSASPPPSTLTITKTKVGSETAGPGEEITYSIHAVSSVEVTNIKITDKIPAHSHFVSATGEGEYNASTNSVVWNTKDIIGAKPGDAKVAITIQVDQTNDIKIANIVHGTSEEAAASFTPANANNCNGKYDFSKWPNASPLKNFGDPNCNFTKDKLYEQLLSNRDGNKVVTNFPPLNGATFAEVWFKYIIPYEATSAFTPNAFAGGDIPEQCALDCGGAWGLFQMGSSNPAGQPPTVPGSKNGIYDRGDLNWEIQVQKANDYNTIHLPASRIWCYWRHARDIGLAQNCN